MQDQAIQVGDHVVHFITGTRGTVQEIAYKGARIAFHVGDHGIWIPISRLRRQRPPDAEWDDPGAPVAETERQKVVRRMMSARYAVVVRQQ